MSEITKRVNSISAKEIRVGRNIFLFSLGASIGKVHLSKGSIQVTENIGIHCSPDFTAIMLVGETRGRVVGYHNGEFVNDKAEMRQL